MVYRVQVYCHPTYTGLVHTVAVHRGVTAGRLAGVIREALDGQGVKVVVEDEEDWTASDLEVAEEEMDERSGPAPT